MEAVLGILGESVFHQIIRLSQEKFKRLIEGLSYRDIKFVKKELRSIYAVLRMVGEVPPDHLNESVRIWAIYLREVSYDMEDILDTFVVRVEGVQPANPDGCSWFVKKFASPFNKDKTGQRIADSIRDIKIIVQEIFLRRGRYMVDVGSAPIMTIDPRIIAMYQAGTKHLVAVDEVMNKLIGMLTEQGDDDLSNQKQLKIVSLVGFAGLGKTTLANELYKKLGSQFDCKAFVSLSPNPNMKRVFGDLLRQLDGETLWETSKAWYQTKIMDAVEKHLRSKRYFIVVDDIWDIKSWLTIKGAMAENNLGSRIVTTTRKFDVAEEVGGAYKVQPLDFESSSILLYRRLFDTDECLNNELVEISQDILKKCGGIPLAIITIASMLARNYQKVQWYEISHNFIKAISGGYGYGNGDSEMLSKILFLSYMDLPFHLRTCLLHLSVFPENYVIRRDRLVWMWIAEGFVYEEEGYSLFEVGHKYFDKLLNSSMIQEIEINEDDGIVKYCCVHDMVLSLVWYLSSKENFVTIWDGTEEQFGPQGNKVRRLSLQNVTVGHQINQATSLCLSQVRSVTAFSSEINLMPLLSRFQVLRVMDLEGTDLQNCNLKQLENLLQLRYLGLRGTHIFELPKEIGNLRMLQVLDLKGTRIKELPSFVARLRRLMCLYIDHTTRLPHGTENLTSLEELSRILINESSTSFVKELTSLTELRVLGIVLQQEVDGSLEKDFMESLCKLPSLKRVTANLCSTNACAAEAALRRAVDVHPNRPTLWVSTVPSHQDREQIEGGSEKIPDVGPSEIEECSA